MRAWWLVGGVLGLVHGCLDVPRAVDAEAVPEAPSWADVDCELVALEYRHRVVCRIVDRETGATCYTFDDTYQPVSCVPPVSGGSP